MGLLLAPYNNAMRLGQGFNSFTHEICIDDAVIVSPERAENVITNDGTTMRIIATVLGEPSVWTKQEEVLLDIRRLKEAEAERQALIDKAEAEKQALVEKAEKEEQALKDNAKAEEVDESAGKVSEEEVGEETTEKEGGDDSADDAAGQEEQNSTPAAGETQEGEADKEQDGDAGVEDAEAVEGDEKTISEDKANEPIEGVEEVEAAEAEVEDEAVVGEEDQPDQSKPEDESLPTVSLEGDEARNAAESSEPPDASTSEDRPGSGNSPERDLKEDNIPSDHKRDDVAENEVIAATPNRNKGKSAERHSDAEKGKKEASGKAVGSGVKPKAVDPAVKAFRGTLNKKREIDAKAAQVKTTTSIGIEATPIAPSKPEKPASPALKKYGRNISTALKVASAGGSKKPGPSSNAGPVSDEAGTATPSSREEVRDVNSRASSASFGAIARNQMTKKASSSKVALLVDSARSAKDNSVAKGQNDTAAIEPATVIAGQGEVISASVEPPVDTPVLEANAGTERLSANAKDNPESSLSTASDIRGVETEPSAAKLTDGKVVADTAKQLTEGDITAPAATAEEPITTVTNEEKPPIEATSNSKPRASVGEAGVLAPAAALVIKEPTADEKRAIEAEAERKAIEADHAKRVKALASAEVRQERDPAHKNAADAYSKALTAADMAKRSTFKFPQSSRFSQSASRKGTTEVFNVKKSHGLSQTVVYSSGFVDTLTEITDDMGISAALTIKTGKLDGSGRGSFIDTDKFKDSDLKYYISVKVINQTINFKDPLEFNKLDNVSEKDFRSVFGDCFVSGFLEGGEFNAVVTMKILNKNKAEDIKAEAAVTLGTDSIQAEAQGTVAIAKANLELNTETTIQVSWQGGGMIKPPEEAWTLESLTRAAARFPDNVAISPQRTYAILTKYETLRSFHQMKPPSLSPINYENAALYAGELMETFMTYKSLYQRLTLQINDIQGGALRFKDIQTVSLPVGDTTLYQSELEKLNASKKSEIALFPASVDGLDDARKQIRRQMNMIVTVIENVGKDPSTIGKDEPFISPIALETLLPAFEPPDRFAKGKNPLGGARLYDNQPKAVKGDDGDDRNLKMAGRMCEIPGQGSLSETERRDVTLNSNESAAIVRYLGHRPELEAYVRLTPALANPIKTTGEAFSALDFIQRKTLLQSLHIYLDNGIVAGIVCNYTNGLSWTKGKTGGKLAEPHVLKISPEERIVSASMTIGQECLSNDKSMERILAIKLHTSAGNSVSAQSVNWKRAGVNRRIIGGRAFKDIRSASWESPLDKGYLVGFWGSSREKGRSQGIFRLGLIWANSEDLYEASRAVIRSEPSGTLDAASLEQSISSQAAEERKTMTKIQTLERALDETIKHLRSQMILAAEAKKAHQDDEALLAAQMKAREDKLVEEANVMLTESRTKFDAAEIAAKAREAEIREEAAKTLAAVKAALDEEQKKRAEAEKQQQEALIRELKIQRNQWLPDGALDKTFWFYHPSTGDVLDWDQDYDGLLVETMHRTWHQRAGTKWYLYSSGDKATIKCYEHQKTEFRLEEHTYPESSTKWYRISSEIEGETRFLRPDWPDEESPVGSAPRTVALRSGPREEGLEKWQIMSYD